MKQDYSGGLGTLIISFQLPKTHGSQGSGKAAIRGFSGASDSGKILGGACHQTHLNPKQEENSNN
jgi:hypothetical protein